MHVVDINKEEWRLAWKNKDVQRGESRFEWVEMSAVVETSDKVQGFLKCWDLSSVTPVPVGSIRCIEDASW